MIVENEINEELNVIEMDTNLVNNVVLKPEEFGEPSRRSTHFIRPRYVPAGRTTNFFFGYIPRKTTTFEEIDLTLISQSGYILNIDEAHNREEIFEHSEKSSVLNLNSTWTTTNFLNYNEYSFSWYRS